MQFYSPVPQFKSVSPENGSDQLFFITSRLSRQSVKSSFTFTLHLLHSENRGYNVTLRFHNMVFLKEINKERNKQEVKKQTNWSTKLIGGKDDGGKCWNDLMVLFSVLLSNVRWITSNDFLVCNFTGLILKLILCVWTRHEGRWQSVQTTWNEKGPSTVITDWCAGTAQKFQLIIWKPVFITRRLLDILALKL